MSQDVLTLAQDLISRPSVTPLMKGAKHSWLKD